MIAVSEAWKAAQKEMLVPLSEIEIEYNITEPGVQADASASATLEETFSAAENTVIELLTEEPKYALLEHNQWLLDGSYTPLPLVIPDATGFVSRNLSGEDGTFTEVPTITVTFSKTHTEYVPGLTMTWSRTYEEWAEAFRVTVYNGSTVVNTINVTGNREAITRLWHPIQGYNIVFFLQGVLPF